jgi:hypothetical protein
MVAAGVMTWYGILYLVKLLIPGPTDPNWVIFAVLFAVFVAVAVQIVEQGAEQSEQSPDRIPIYLRNDGSKS